MNNFLDIPESDWRNSETNNGKWIVGETNGQKGGFYVEAGAWDGIICSSTYVLAKHFGWHGLLVEPAPQYQRALPENRPESYCITGLLSDENTTETFLRFPQLHGYSCMEKLFSKFEKKITKAHEEAGTPLDIETYEVPAMTLEWALDKSNAPQMIDFISLDIEGAEYLVLKEFPFDKYYIRYICLEDPEEVLHQLLLAKGFEQVSNPFNIDAPREKYYANANPYFITENIKLKDAPPLKLPEAVSYPDYRLGWRMAMQSLQPLFQEEGILFDNYLEATFCEKYVKAQKEGVIPYKEPWIGFFHNPQGAPAWTPSQFHLDEILALPEFQESLVYCKGLFALSSHHAAYLREKTGKPVSVLFHPTKLHAKKFDMDAFTRNPIKKVFQVGLWLHKLNSIFQLPLKKRIYRKLVALPSNHLFALFNQIRREEQERLGLTIAPPYGDNTFCISHLRNEDYDELFSKNIAFIDLYDASADNAIIECIARATPILVNRIPATEEYLGEEYPFFYDSLEEAAQKALDFKLVKRTHHYLCNWHVREKLSAQYFVESFVASEVYQQFISPLTNE